MTIAQQLTEKLQNAQQKVFTPKDTQYAEHTLGWNRSFKLTPEIVILPTSEQDILDTITIARQENYPIAILGTGHGGRSIHGGILINMQKMNKITINPDNRQATIQAGAVWGNVVAETATHGLAIPAGSSPNVGVTGLTTGGGIGWLSNKYGVTAQYVESFTLITAEGKRIQANKKEHTELYWALRGGSGTYAIITEITYNHLPSITKLYGGILTFPKHLAKELFLTYIDWVKKSKNSWTTSFAILNYPQHPSVPANLQGKTVVEIRGCCCDRQEESALAPFLNRKPLSNSFRLLPLSEIFTISNDPVEPMSSFVGGGDFLQNLDERCFDILSKAALGGETASPLTFTELRHVAHIPEDTSMSFTRAQGEFLFMATGDSPDANTYHQQQTYVEKLRQELAPWRNGVTYRPTVEGNAMKHRSMEYPLQTLEKLKKIKQLYDPTNIFPFGYF